MNYGFIGLGNMASAILRGMKKSGRFLEDSIYGFDPSEAKMAELAESCGIIPKASGEAAAEKAEVIILCVKPQILPEALEQISPAVTSEKAVISIVTGKTTEFIGSALSGNVPVVRVMPNINAKVGGAVSAVCGGRHAGEEHISTAKNIFLTIGGVFDVSEDKFSAYMAIAAASPAFVYLFIDALASAGVRAGFPKTLATEIAAGAVLGSAMLTAESGEHPRALMDQVCSPGGTTIEGVQTLQRLGFETSVHQAVDAVIKKDKSL